MSNSVDDYLASADPGNPGQDDAEAFKEEINQNLAMAGNSAMFGLAPKAAWLVGKLLPGEKGQGEEYETKTAKYLDKARQDNPIGSVISELVGGLAVPIPGMGLGKAALSGIKGATTASRLAKGVAEGVIGGGAAGAIRGATEKYGQSGSSGISEAIPELLSGGVKGGVGGAVIGGVLGGAGQTLAERASGARLAATGTGMGEMNTAARMTNTRDPRRFMEGVKNRELGFGGEVERQKILGHHPFQTGEDVAIRSSEAAEKAGKELGALIKKVAADPTTKVPSASIGIDTLREARASLKNPDANKEMKEGAKLFINWMKSHTDKHRAPSATVENLHNMSMNARVALEGFQGFQTPTDTVRNSFIKKFMKEANDDIVRAAGKGVDRDLARQVATASNNFHDLATLRGLSSDPAMRWDAVRQTPLGKGIMSQAQTLIWKQLGLPPLLSRAAAGLSTAPGATPNTLIWLDRLRRQGKLGSREGLGGVVGGWSNRLED